MPISPGGDTMGGVSVKPGGRAVFFLLFLLWGMALPSVCLAHDTSGVIKFAVFPFKSPRSVIEVFAPIVARLEEKLGKTVQIVSAPDADSFLNKGLAGEYDLAMPSVSAYYKMVPAGYAAIARGEPSFRGGVIVRQESTITSIEQCRGKKIAAIGEHSYAGFLFFKAMLEGKKIDPAKDVDIHFLKQLDTIIYGVLNKNYHAGVIRLDTLDMKAFAPIKNQLRVVARSAEIPQFPFVVKSGTDQRTIAAIREVLTSLSPDKPEDLRILESLQVKKIVAVTNADYNKFHDVVKDSEFLRHH